MGVILIRTTLWNIMQDRIIVSQTEVMIRAIQTTPSSPVRVIPSSIRKTRKIIVSLISLKLIVLSLQQILNTGN